MNRLGNQTSVNGEGMNIKNMEKILEEKLYPEGASANSSSQESDSHSLDSLKMESPDAPDNASHGRKNNLNSPKDIKMESPDTLDNASHGRKSNLSSPKDIQMESPDIPGNASHVRKNNLSSPRDFNMESPDTPDNASHVRKNNLSSPRDFNRKSPDAPDNASHNRKTSLSSAKEINMEDVKIKTRTDWSTHPPTVIPSNGFMSSLKLKNRSMSEYIMSTLQKKPSQKAKSVSFTAGSGFLESIMNIGSINLLEEHPDLIEAIQNDDLNLVESKMKEKSIKLNSVLMATIERDKVNLLEFLLCDIEDIKSISEKGKCLLHVAAEYGAICCCQYLLSKGLDPGTWDSKEESTPMHCIARSQSKNNKKILELFLNNGGNINMGLSSSSGSPLYAAVQENNLEMVKYILSQKPEITESSRPFSETPLHLAADYNYYECAEALLEANQTLVDLKSDKEQNGTALHIAAEHGYPETCYLLLKYKADLSITNKHGMTPLHMAARHLHGSIISIFLDESEIGLTLVNGQDKLVNAQDKDGRTPLFSCTTSNGPAAVECMDILISHGADVDKPDTPGFTPLHMAAIGRDVNKVTLLISKDADLSRKNQAGLSALYFINKKVPQCMKFFEQRLDSGVKLDRGSRNDFGARLKIDFNKIVRNIGSNEENERIDIFSELAKSPHQRLLKHPLIESFLHLKWNQYKWLHAFHSIFAHFVFSVIYTLYALYIFRIVCPADKLSDKLATNLTSTVTCDLTGDNEQYLPLIKGSWILLLLFTVVYFCKEVSKSRINQLIYWKRFESYLDIIIILSVPLISFHKNPFSKDGWVFLRWQYHVAAMGVLAVWCDMMLHIGRVPKFGKYVQMFLAVSTGVFNFLIAYIFLLVAFWSSFLILFPNAPAFEPSNGPSGIIKVIVMMLGELEYDDLYYNQNQFLTNSSENNRTEIGQEVEHQVFPFTAHVVLIVFIILVSIILMNLLVGLAVSDIQKLSTEGKLHRTVRQVELINQLHALRVVVNKILMLNPFCWRLHRSYNSVYVVKLFDLNNTLFTENIKQNLYDLCLRRQDTAKEESRDKQIAEILGLLRKQAGTKIFGRTSLGRKGSGDFKFSRTFSKAISIEEDEQHSWNEMGSENNGSPFSTEDEDETDSEFPAEFVA